MRSKGEMGISMKFILDGFIAEAPEDITLKELLKQTDRLIPDWCARGIRSCEEEENNMSTDVYIEKSSISLAHECVPATIKGE